MSTVLAWNLGGLHSYIYGSIFMWVENVVSGDSNALFLDRSMN